MVGGMDLPNCYWLLALDRRTIKECHERRCNEERFVVLDEIVCFILFLH